ncbi:sugar kinase [Oryzibacter oryziterrae]|uniref:sugar kinase n=1 Tax=Oryzibacter oryziterrae TaxID=2766474 RepID=UPI001F241F2C|nr:sugar kinase [Oryzibacter oryziterrae]
MSEKVEPLRIAAIGECMVELQEAATGSISSTFGGDTFNTAAYMARLTAGTSTQVDYISAIGDDPFSADMAAFWRAQGVGDGKALRLKGRRPGLYFIKLDDKGERRFFYWRGEAAARDCFEAEGSDALLEALGGYDLIYLSGISLAILKPAGRERLLARLAELAGQGVEIDFDCNWRPVLWDSVASTRKVYERVLGFATRVLITIEELEVFGEPTTPEAGVAYFAAHPGLEVVIKAGGDPCTVIAGGNVATIAPTPVPKVVDTTAAGDSFSAGYLLARRFGLDPQEAARRAHAVAGTVVQHRGAIIPAGVLPDVFAAENARRRPSL